MSLIDNFAMEVEVVLLTAGDPEQTKMAAKPPIFASFLKCSKILFKKYIKGDLRFTQGLSLFKQSFTCFLVCDTLF